MIIKVRFASGGEPHGREYTYSAPDTIAVGDRIDIDGRRHGVVTAINVSEQGEEAFKGNPRPINGKL